MRTPMLRAFVFLTLLLGTLAIAQEMKPEELYQKVLPSVMTLRVEKKDGTQCLGAGFLAVKDGVAVTAWHVVNGAKHVVARFSNGEEFEVSGLIDKDEARDVAWSESKSSGDNSLP